MLYVPVYARSKQHSSRRNHASPAEDCAGATLEEVAAKISGAVAEAAAMISAVEKTGAAATRVATVVTAAEWS